MSDGEGDRVALSPLDDFPVHQIAEPIRRIATSDRNFYDRYYFNCHPCSDELFLITGLGVYPNLSVVDAFAVVLHEGTHRIVRASRVLGNDRMDTSVGPFRIEVIEGLKRLRVILEPNDFDLHFDLEWTGAEPAHEEPRHFMRQQERVVFDTARLAQTGSWSGALSVAGRDFHVTPDRWWGTRDRSWGVRPVGEPEPPGIRGAQVPGTFFWNYAPMRFPDHAIFYIAQEDRDGTRLLEEALRVHPEETGRAPEHLGRPEHHLEFVAGTRNVKRATITMTEPDGSPLEISVEPLLPLHLGVGTGYGRDDDWRHGMYQGELVVQGLSFGVDEIDPATRMFGITDCVARFQANGTTGYGLWEYLVAGPHDRYGFQGFDDVARA